MKKLLLFLTLIFLLVSCTNSYNDLDIQDNVVSLAKAPKVIAYSGDIYFNDFTTRSGAETGSFERWQGDRDWDLPHNIIEPEMNYVFKYLQEHPNEGYKSVDIDTYIIQVVGGAEHSYDGDTPDHNGTMHTVGNASGEMRYCEIDGFFTQFNNTGMNSENPLLIRNVPATNATYKDTYGTTWDDCYAFYYINFPDDPEYGYMAGKTGLYLCYDFKTYKESEKWGVSPDGIYDDWVIKLSPYEGGFFEDSKGEEPKNPDENPEIGVTPPEHSSTGEVEVNLHGTDKGDGLLESHLSIHVRHATDVEIFIPVPMEYYCEADDMAIVQKHDQNHMIHGGPYKVEYILQDREDGPFIVSLNIRFADEGIYIWTDGINQDVIDFCNKHYGDGITFEVWNYFNDSISLDILKEYLNQSTIKFLDSIPESFINAIVDKDDCVVREDNESY